MHCTRPLEHLPITILEQHEKTICFRVHEELEASLSNVDAYMSDYIAKHANRLFKNKQMTYKPLLQLKED